MPVLCSYLGSPLPLFTKSAVRLLCRNAAALLGNRTSARRVKVWEVGKIAGDSGQKSRQGLLLE